MTGVTRAHARLIAHRDSLEADARAHGFEIAADCWVERLKIATGPPAENRPNAEFDALDVDALIAEAAADPDFAAAIAELQRLVTEKLPGAVRGDLKLDDAVSLARDFLKGERQ